jgi:hypothetical protein
MIFSVTEQDKGNLFNHIKTIFKENHFQYYTEDSLQWGCRDRIVVGFTTTCAISTYYH